MLGDDETAFDFAEDLKPAGEINIYVGSTHPVIKVFVKFVTV
jgi:hypothetical protein